jgi:hypothetical protein
MDAVVPKDEKRSRLGEKLVPQRIGKKLCQVYAEIVAEPIPDRFIQIIEKLEVEEKRRHRSKLNGRQQE